MALYRRRTGPLSACLSASSTDQVSRVLEEVGSVRELFTGVRQVAEEPRQAGVHELCPRVPAP
jgi:hypothetical protein